MSEYLSFAVEAQSEAADTKYVWQMLARFNANISGDDHHQVLNVMARDADGAIRGGLLGNTYWGWLHVEILCVQEELRSHGVGSRLLQAAEAEALRRGCSHSHLDTFEFQAPGFYQKRGYVVFGELEGLPPGHRRIFLRKDLVPARKDSSTAAG